MRVCTHVCMYLNDLIAPKLINALDRLHRNYLLTAEQGIQIHCVTSRIFVFIRLLALSCNCAFFSNLSFTSFPYFFICILYFTYLIIDCHAALAYNKFYIPTAATLLSISSLSSTFLLSPVWPPSSAIFLSLFLISSPLLLTRDHFLVYYPFLFDPRIEQKLFSFSKHLPLLFLPLFSFPLLFQIYLSKHFSQALPIKLRLGLTALNVRLLYFKIFWALPSM